ncbi:MAG UNVERIFIED_CONTAM: hypothetical protein LVR18_26980 [Planctomycetaceae bacterium]
MVSLFVVEISGSSYKQNVLLCSANNRIVQTLRIATPPHELLLATMLIP